MDPKFYRTHQLEIESNPSYSTVCALKEHNSECNQTEPTYDVVNAKRDHVDQVRLKEKNEYDEIQETNRGFQKDKSFTACTHNKRDQQKAVGPKHKSDKGLGAQCQLEVESNLSYGTISVGEYSLARPAYYKVNKTSKSSGDHLEVKHEYAKIQDVKKEYGVQVQQTSRYEVANLYH